VPPNPADAGFGLGFSYPTFTLPGFTDLVGVSGGPNDGYHYYASKTAIDVSFPYVINPDLNNQNSVFFKSQCGDFDPVSRPFGFISGVNLELQLRRHEYTGKEQSHYAFFSKALADPKNNPGDFLETRVHGPGLNHVAFHTTTITELRNRVKVILDASGAEPYPANHNEQGEFLGNVNYYPYQSCP